MAARQNGHGRSDHHEPHRKRRRQADVADEESDSAEELGHADEVHHPEGELPATELLDERRYGGQLRRAENVMHLTAQKICRFGELRRKLPRITQRMLTLQSCEMESDGLVMRRVFAEVPPRVEYALTEVGRDLKSVYMAIQRWGLRHPEAERLRHLKTGT